MKMNYLEIVIEKVMDVNLNQHVLDMMIDHNCGLDEQTIPKTTMSLSPPSIGEKIHILIHPIYQVSLLEIRVFTKPNRFLVPMFS
jgi:hypothetical protein